MTRRFPLSQRQDAEELLDLGQGTQAEMEASLRDLWRINRYLGGLNALTRPLFQRLRVAGANGQPVTVVDIGAGSAEIAHFIARWARRSGLRLNMIALDLTARHLAIARARLPIHSGVHLVQANADCLPFAPGEVDYFISSLFMHHFSPPMLASLLKQAFSLARRGIVMSDVARGVLPLVGFMLVQPIFARSPLTRYDGVVSAKRAYSPGELLALADEAGLNHAHILHGFPFRMTLVSDK